jgi:hypothetical protein
MVRGRWDGSLQTTYSPMSGSRDSHILLPPDDHGIAAVAAIGPNGAMQVGPFVMHAIGLFPNEITARTPPYFDIGVYGAGRSEAGLTWVLGGANGDMSLAAHDGTSGAVLSKQAVRLVGYRDPPLWAAVPMVFRKENVHLGWGKQLVCVFSDGRLVDTEMPAPIRSLSASPPFTATRIIATFDEGWALLRDGGHPGKPGRD